MALSAGEYQPGATIRLCKQGTTVAITKGTIARWDQTNDGYTVETADASILGPFGVCVSASATGATQVLLAVKGVASVTADGTIEPYDLVQMASATDGQVITYAQSVINAAATDDIKAARDEFLRIVGQYVGTDTTGDGTIVADASDGNVIWVDLDIKH